ncbi:hypothetical protein AbraIFM66950_006562 [Aspergillus brasiliensis]|nr:hypothetical protein AbraIFM66950_006562 [Aspergillus brasiliensis]
MFRHQALVYPIQLSGKDQCDSTGRDVMTVLKLVIFSAQVPATRRHAIILNTCAFPIYAWSVSSSVGPQITIPAAVPSTSRNTTYSNYTEPYHHDPQTGGVSIKLTTLRNGLYTGAPQTIFAYNFEEGQNQVWFDLSDVFGDPFKGRRVSVQVRGPLGDGGGWEESIVWEDGVPGAGSQVRVVSAERDLVVRLCS